MPRESPAARNQRSSVRGLGDWVEAAAVEGLAAEQPQKGETASLRQAVPFDGLARVHGARRLEAAGARKPGGDRALVTRQDGDDDAGGKAHAMDRAFDSAFRRVAV